MFSMDMDELERAILLSLNDNVGEVPSFETMQASNAESINFDSFLSNGNANTTFKSYHASSFLGCSESSAGISESFGMGHDGNTKSVVSEKYKRKHVELVDCDSSADEYEPCIIDIHLHILQEKKGSKGTMYNLCRESMTHFSVQMTENECNDHLTGAGDEQGYVDADWLIKKLIAEMSAQSKMLSHYPDRMARIVGQKSQFKVLVY